MTDPDLEEKLKNLLSDPKESSSLIEPKIEKLILRHGVERARVIRMKRSHARWARAIAVAAVVVLGSTGFFYHLSKKAEEQNDIGKIYELHLALSKGEKGIDANEDGRFDQGDVDFLMHELVKLN